ncbi:hypothetical protein V6N12_035673 [Hibiscus sabdariffa]|uniref:Uncharacterized protein n=1 Tax=Hibiscus sabdariffa TaxID=183260 RepID=A0ABR2END6_9ROSI
MTSYVLMCVSHMNDGGLRNGDVEFVAELKRCWIGDCRSDEDMGLRCGFVAWIDFYFVVISSLVSSRLFHRRLQVLFTFLSDHLSLLNDCGLVSSFWSPWLSFGPFDASPMVALLVGAWGIWLKISLSMAFISWNVRGLGKKDIVRALNNAIFKFHQSIVFLSETKQNNRYFVEIIMKMKFSNAFYIDPLGIAKGLELWWKVDSKITIISSETKHITNTNRSINDEDEWFGSFIYGPCMPKIIKVSESLCNL